jgi:predicted GNAT superfamily acetyltransferase
VGFHWYTHFYQTSFVAEKEGEIVGFIIGFLSPAYSDEAYIHFVGIHPNHRNEGIGRLLYKHFFDIVRHKGRSIVHCVTSPVNQRSINFHQRMGFEIVPGDSEINGVSFVHNYDGPNEDRVLFVNSFERNTPLAYAVGMDSDRAQALISFRATVYHL